MDSILQNILEKETTIPETEEQPQEDSLEVAAEEVVEEKTTEGGEE